MAYTPPPPIHTGSRSQPETGATNRITKPQELSVSLTKQGEREGERGGKRGSGDVAFFFNNSNSV